MNTHKRRDGWEIAHENEFMTLMWLNRFRWLTSGQIARLVWPASATQAQRMAQRTLKRLVEQKEVLVRQLRNGVMAYVMGERGSYRLRSNGIDARTRGERDARLGAPYHRALANEIAIYCIKNGWNVWTEHEIQRGIAPLRSAYGHVPDLLIQESSEHPLTWFEVENTPKSRAKLRALMQLAEDLVGAGKDYRVTEELWIDAFVFVTPNFASLKSVYHTLKSASDTGIIDFTTTQRMHVWACNFSQKFIWNGQIDTLSANWLIYYMETNGTQAD